ncbi:MAG: hypothetical protein JXR13_17420 [Thalassovita sp.]
MTNWRNGIERTVNAFKDVVGDVNILELRPENAFAYKSHLTTRQTAGEISPYTVNREIYTLNTAIKRTVKNRFGRDSDLFKGMLVQDKRGKRRNRQVSFSSDRIVENLLEKVRFGGCNQEALDIFWCQINTSARPSELVSLRRETIILDHEVPHISIEPDDRETKTASAERLVPLVGRSLEILKKYPDGFQRYRGKADRWSATINKSLRANNLLPTEQHKATSLRHSLSDRLLNAGCTEAIKDQLFGHVEDGTPYGEGVWLETSRDWLLNCVL